MGADGLHGVTMLRRMFNPLVGAFAASALLHLTVLVPLLMLAMMKPPAGLRAAIDVHIAPEEVAPPAPPPPPPLGLDAPNPSSLTWIGYEEFQEHLAALAEVEQAAFTDEPVGAEVVEVVELAEEAVEENESITGAKPESGDALERLLRMAGMLPPVVSRLKEAPARVGENDATVSGELEEIVVEPLREDKVPPIEVETVDAGDAERVATPASGEVGDQADKQTDPTSVIEVPPEHWRLGKPLAAQGVELRPQRPHFTIVQRLTAAPGNPLVEITFRGGGGAGEPAEATILHSTGVSSIDAALLASLYRWRASGEAIEALAEGQTFNVRIRIILNPRAG
jgi:hypothetical protein